jgi:hypothetical protein
MSDITISKTINIDEGIDKERLISMIDEEIHIDFDKVKIEDEGSHYSLYCRVKTKLLNPIVSLKGTIQTNIKGNKARILIDVGTKTNGWFWFTFIIFLFFSPWIFLPIGFFFLMFMYFSQKKKSTEAFQNVFERLSFQSGEF